MLEQNNKKLDKDKRNQELLILFGVTFLSSFLLFSKLIQGIQWNTSKKRNY